MKKIVFFSGIVSAQLMLFGCMFKVMHWMGASVLLCLAVFCFCFFFLPAALIKAYNDQPEKKYAAIYAATFIVFFIDMLGILFKVQHWPGASVFLLIGIPLPFVLFLPVYLFQTRNEKKGISNGFPGIMFGLIFLAVFSVLLSMNFSKSTMVKLGINYKNNETTLQFNEVVLLTAKPVVSKPADELCSYISSMKCEMLKASGNELCGNNGVKANAIPEYIMNMESSDIPKQFLRTESGNNKIKELKNKISLFKNSCLNSGKITPPLSELINKLFDLNEQINTSGEEKISWEERTFSDYTLITVLNSLTKIQSNVRLIENEIAQ